MRASMFSGVSLSSLIAAFLLGACVTAVTQSQATTRSQDQATASHASKAGVASVLPLDAAPQAQAPNGLANVWHLARGHNAYLGRLEMQAGAAVPEHRDSTEEYIHILEGTGVVTIEGFEHQVQAGSTIYMPANALVSFQNGDQKLLGIQVFAGPEPSAKYDAWKAM